LDVAKAIVCGADVVQIASALLEHGPDYLTVIRDQLVRCLRDKEYASSDEARGVLARRSAPDRHAWERLQYTRMIEAGSRSGAAARSGAALPSAILRRTASCVGGAIGIDAAPRATVSFVTAA